MRLKHYTRIKEKLYTCTLKNKMQVFYIPQKGYQEKIAMIATNFGSFHSTISPTIKKNAIPKGAAHFLEHRMFSIKNEDATAYFADLKANSNAFTSYNKTAYYFSTSENFYENLKVLLTMLSSFDSSEKQVENEKQIIIEELNMYKDDPYTKLMTTLYKNAYHIHPIKDDIGGTNESVLATTKEDLKNCFDTYYDPSQLTLVIAGDLNVEELEKFLNQHLISNKDGFQRKKISFSKEPTTIVKEKEIITGNVSIPLFGLIYKLKPYTKRQDQLKEIIKMEILLGYFFDASGTFTENWLRKKIITSAIGYYHCSNIDLNCIILYNINSEYDQTLSHLIEVFDKKHLDMKKEDFDRIKNKMIGQCIKNYGDGPNLAKDFLSYQLDGYDYFKEIDKINEITIDEIKEVYLEICNSPYAVVIERGEER